MVQKPKKPDADICIIVEGTYPYVAGGVASWTQDLIIAQKEFTFHILSLMPPGDKLVMRYELPENVTGVTNIFVQELASGASYKKEFLPWLMKFEKPFLKMVTDGNIDELKRIIQNIQAGPPNQGREILLNSPGAWNLLENMYCQGFEESSFMHYFWTWRMLVSGLFSILRPPLPQAKLYHTVSTGFAGALGARAHIETGSPLILTEHGIYTNERRIELAMAGWIYERNIGGFSINKATRGLKDLIIDYFIGFSNVTYQAAAKIITLYAENQVLQLEDGAAAEKLLIIPNGIDYPRFSIIEKIPHDRPTVALIGRIVPIKDIKTFIRACATLKNMVPNVLALAMGPTEEDPEYYEECKTMVQHLGMEDYFEFTGRVKLDDYLGKVDVIALTSVSEAQPLTILEAGASGIPSVTTNVGACYEMINGQSGETPALGPGGEVVPLASPKETAKALAKLLTNKKWYEQCSNAIQARVRKMYNQQLVNQAYYKIYREYIPLPEQQLPTHPPTRAEQSWA